MIASCSRSRTVSYTSMQISCSTTFQRFSIASSSGDCGNHIGRVNSVSCARNQLEIVQGLWQCIILLEQPSDDGTLWPQTDGHDKKQREAVASSDAQLVRGDQKCTKKISPTTLHHLHQPGPLLQGTETPILHWYTIQMNLNLKSDCQSSNKCFFQSTIVQFWWTHVNCSLGFLFCAQQHTVWYSAAVHHLLQGLMCCAVGEALLLSLFFCHCLSVLLLSFYYIDPVWLSSDLWHKHGIFTHMPSSKPKRASDKQQFALQLCNQSNMS